MIKSLVEWITLQVDAAGAAGLVFGLSGGLDSAIVGALCHDAAGGSSLGVIMPCHSDPLDVEDARLVAEQYGIQAITVDLCQTFDCLLRLLPGGPASAAANLKPRLRMTVLYHMANTRGYLVVGTGNKSEISVGYFTKFGDGGADLFPLAGIYKTDLIEVARSLDVPDRILRKAPSAGLWEGQTDEGEMGVTYRDIDGILKALEEGRRPEFDAELIEKVEKMVSSSEHKRCAGPRFYPDSGDESGINEAGSR